jgi:2-keto-4-pentenoate hydratase/2-oxohepta-3-ene-1,7-dioic acid hydratase in catechol pathway
MKIIRFALGQSIHYGVIEGTKVFQIDGNIFDLLNIGKHLCHINDVQLLAPVQPKIVVGVGRNYRKPGTVDDENIPPEPQLFFKPSSSVIGHLNNIIYPKISKDVRSGGELAVVMKRKAINDLTAFDINERDVFVTRPKSFYTFCPIGPCIATDIGVDNLKITSKLNGNLKQQGSTREMIFSISKIISYISEFMALEPGDVVLTGTPGEGSFGVNVGDTIDVEIEGIGLLRNPVVSGGRALS